MENNLPRGTETVLLVDGDGLTRASTARVLERLGYKVLQAGDAEQALHLATLSNIHLLVMDIVLPQMNGLALAPKVANLRPNVRVLYTSAHASEEVLDPQARSRAEVGFLQKPYGPGDLAREVRRLLDLTVSRAPAPTPIPRGSEAILVVDPHGQSRRETVRNLQRLGYHTLEAALADRALAIAVHSRVDLVILDLAAADMDGAALAREISVAKQGLRFLFLAESTVEAPPIPEELTGGEPRVLQKPPAADELGRAVRGVLDQPRDNPTPPPETPSGQPGPL